MTPQTAAEKAVSVVGCGFDLTNDIHFSACKAGPDGSRLIVLDEVRGAGDLVVPGGVVVHNVSGSIKCDKGERTRFRSDFLSFHQTNWRSADKIPEEENKLSCAVAALVEDSKEPIGSEVTKRAKTEEDTMAMIEKPIYPQLPEEPQGDWKLLCKVGIRVPDGRRLQRNFLNHKD